MCLFVGSFQAVCSQGLTACPASCPEGPQWWFRTHFKAWRALAGAALSVSSDSHHPWGSGHPEGPSKTTKKVRGSHQLPVRDRRWEELSRQTAHLPPRAVGPISPPGDAPHGQGFTELLPASGTVPPGAGSPPRLRFLFPTLPWQKEISISR